MEFAIVATGVILLLLILGLAFLPPRKDAEAPSEVADPYDSLYGQYEGRPPVRPGQGLSGEGHGSRSTERTRQLGEDGEVSVEGNPVEPPDPER